MTEAKAKPEPAPKEDAEPEHVQVVTPVVVEMGKLSKKQLKAFKGGEGPLMDEVLDVLEEVALGLGQETENRTFVPVVMVFEKQPKKKKRTIVLPF